jgi:chromosome segregation ATPase
MATRQNLLAEISDLRLVVTKEWIKQVYFRKEKHIEYNIIIDEVQDIEKILKDQIAMQEEFLNIPFNENEDFEEYTPRFLSAQNQAESSSPFSVVLKTLAAFKRIVSQSFENQRAMVSKYQGAEEQNQTVLSLKYEKEREKVNKLTQKYNDLNLEFLNLQEMLEELAYDRDHRKPCESCNKLKEKVRDLEERLKSHPSDEIKKFKEMYEEIKAAHDEIAEELNSQPQGNLEELEYERENFMRQVSYLQETQKQLETLNADLMKKLESESSQVIKLNGFIDEYEEDLKKKNSSLEKAQNIIKKLNNECEKLAKDCEKVDNENKTLKKDYRTMNKNKHDVEKKINDIETMKKTEERLREEIISLKNKYSQVLEQKEIQINHLNGLLLQQSQDKNNLELAFEELEAKLNEIDQINKKRVEEFALLCQKHQELELILKKKDENLIKIHEDYEKTILNKDQEFSHLKRQAENMIRHLNTTQSPGKSIPSPIQSSSEPNKQSLIQQLEDALIRENNLKNLLTSLVTNEGQTLKKLLKTFNNLTNVSRSEVERWIMRNEELEQRIIEISSKNIKLNSIVKDLEKIIYFKSLQFEEFFKNSDGLVKEQQSKIDFLTLELNEYRNSIGKDILPFSQKLFNSSLSANHEKIHSLRQEVAHFEAQMALNTENISKLNKIIKNLEEEKDSISKLLYRSNASIVYIDKHIKDVTPLHPSALEATETQERLTIIPESENIANEITEQAKNIANKIMILQDNQQRYVEKLFKNDYDILQLQNTLKDKNDLNKTFEDSIKHVQEENRYLTEIAYKEKEEKIKAKSMLSEQSDAHEKITALTEYIDQINKEMSQLEHNCYYLRSELDSSQSILAIKCQQLEETKENSQREISKLRLDLESTLQESKLASNNLVYQLQQTISDQEKSIALLKEQLYASEVKLKELTTYSPERDQSYYTSLIQDLQEKLQKSTEENIDLKSALNIRDSRKSPVNYTNNFESLISQKNEMIASLEKELTIYKEKTFSYSQTSNVYEELEKMKKKKESDRKNFQKRVEEFELVLRYIEDKINYLLNSRTDLKTDRMQSLLDELARKNPNLILWLKNLVNNLENLSARGMHQRS